MATLWHGNPGGVATPGSVQARAGGCTCDVYINQSGRGLVNGMKDLQGRPVFSVTSGCGLHATTDVGHVPNSGTTPLPLPPVAQLG